MTKDRLYNILVANLLLLFTSCCCLSDPSYTGMVSKAPACEWVPKCYYQRKIAASSCSSMRPQEGETLSLFRMIDIALWNNPDTYHSWAEARAAAFNLEATESLLYPQVDLQQTLLSSQQLIGPAKSVTSAKSSAGTTVVGDSSRKCSDSFDLLVSDLRVKYLLFDFGGRCSEIESAKQALIAANWSHNREIQTVIFDLLDAFYNHIDAVASYKASLSDLADAWAILDSAKQMHKAGVKTIADVLQAQSNYSGIKLSVEKNYSDVKTSMGKIARLMGLPADTPLAVELLPEDFQLAELNASIEELMEAAKKWRPDLASLEAKVFEKRATLKVAESAGKPQLYAGVDIEDDYYLNNRDLNSYIYNGAFVLDVPIFTGFYYQNRIRQARADVETATAELMSREYDVLFEVLQAYYNYQTAVVNYGYSEDFLLSSEQNYDVAKGNYRQGTGTIIDLLTAQKNLAEARAKRIDSRTLWLTSLADIAYTTGTIDAETMNKNSKECRG